MLFLYLRLHRKSRRSGEPVVQSRGLVLGVCTIETLVICVRCFGRWYIILCCNTKIGSPKIVVVILQDSGPYIAHFGTSRFRVSCPGPMELRSTGLLLA